jgi:lipoic acid synthetase
MLGLGETREEVVAAMEDLRAVECQRLTLGQYLRPSLAHLPVDRYWSPEEFDELGAVARAMGFAQVRSGPLVRSSYHAGV